MHRVILARKLGRPLLKKEEVDHEHGDGLDNRRDELRPATDGQNARNCRRRKENPSSRYLGVSRYTRGENWQSETNINGKRIYLGRYATEFEAALAREYYITAHPELMARANFTHHEGPI